MPKKSNISAHLDQQSKDQTLLGVTLDPTERFIACKTATFLMRGLCSACLVEASFYNQLQLVLDGDIRVVGKFMTGKLEPEYKREVKDKLLRLKPDPYDYMTVCNRTDRAALPEILACIKDCLNNRIAQLSSNQPSDMELKLQALTRFFNLKPIEVEFIMFFFLIITNDHFRDLFRDQFRCTKYVGRGVLAKALNCKTHELSEVFSGSLVKAGFLDLSCDDVEMDVKFFKYLCGSSTEFNPEGLFKKMDCDCNVIPLESHTFLTPGCTEHLLNLLSAKHQTATHVLLYGAPGTGKTSYAKGLAKQLGVPTYEIIQSNTPKDRRAGIIACLNVTNSGDGSIVIVDEADALLNTRPSWFGQDDALGKGWLNKLLEDPGVRMIWITNRIDDMEGSVQRRFAFSLQFKKFGRKQRELLWGNILERHGRKDALPENRIKDFSKRYDVSAGIIDIAVKKACETTGESQKAFYSAVKLGVESHDILIKGGNDNNVMGENLVDPCYDLAGLNIETNIQDLLRNIEAFDCKLRQSKRAYLESGMNLLFYGPPGTGKSELAKYIAARLEREPVFKRPAELLDSYLGGTEKRIASAFREAEDEGAVLIIDEVDSFLFSRDKAVRSWEVSSVNEFLTRMESFRGVLVCTTNRFTELDLASVRRFSHKIGFNYLTPAGNITFYNKMLNPLTIEHLKPHRVREIKGIPNLAPGDFKTVRSKHIVFPLKDVSHDMLINALKEESKLKDAHCMNRTAIGF